MCGTEQIFQRLDLDISEYYLPPYSARLFEDSLVRSLLDNLSLALLGDHSWPLICLFATFKRESFLRGIESEHVVFLDDGHTEMVYLLAAIFSVRPTGIAMEKALLFEMLCEQALIQGYDESVAILLNAVRTQTIRLDR